MRANYRMVGLWLPEKSACNQSRLVAGPFVLLGILVLCNTSDRIWHSVQETLNKLSGLEYSNAFYVYVSLGAALIHIFPILLLLDNRGHLQKSERWRGREVERTRGGEDER